MNLIQYSPNELQEARRLLREIGVASAVLREVDENLSHEIEFRNTTTIPELAGLVQQSLTTLNDCTINTHAGEMQLYYAWLSVRTAIQAIRPVSQTSKLQ